MLLYATKKFVTNLPQGLIQHILKNISDTGNTLYFVIIM